MTRLVFRVLPAEEPKVSEVLKKIYYSGIEGIMVPSGLEMVSFAKSSLGPQQTSGGDNPSAAEAGPSSDAAPSSSSSVNVPLVVVDDYADQSTIVERRIALEYTAEEHFPLLTLLNPENEMVPERAEREELALNLLDTMVAAHSINLCHGQLNSERVFVHSDEPKCYLSDFYVGKSYNPYVCPRDYRGPESILRCWQGDDAAIKVDVWAMGCLLYELLSTEPLFTLPSSRDEVGVTVPMLIQRQIATVVARVCRFPNNSGSNTGDSSTFSIDAAALREDFGHFGDQRIVPMFNECCADPAARSRHLNPDASSSAKRRQRDFLVPLSEDSTFEGSSDEESEEADDRPITSPFAWAVQQCLTFCPSRRPSLKFVRDGLLERLGRSRDEVAMRNAEVEAIKARLSAQSRVISSQRSSPAESPLVSVVASIKHGGDDEQ